MWKCCLLFNETFWTRELDHKCTTARWLLKTIISRTPHTRVKLQQFFAIVWSRFPEISHNGTRNEGPATTEQWGGSSAAVVLKSGAKTRRAEYLLCWISVILNICDYKGILNICDYKGIGMGSYILSKYTLVNCVYLCRDMPCNHSLLWFVSNE